MGAGGRTNSVTRCRHVRLEEHGKVTFVETGCTRKIAVGPGANVKFRAIGCTRKIVVGPGAKVKFRAKGFTIVYMLSFREKHVVKMYSLFAGPFVLCS